MGISKWFTFGWWAYLLVGCKGWGHFWCRVREHPRGPTFFNPGGDEPNWKCRDCGEDLG
jgi:hypothetical protein